MSSVFQVENLHVALQGQSVLSHFELSLNQGDILCLLGPSGCGKTTALKALGGLIPAQKGVITLFDKTLKKNAYELPPEQRDMGFIFQDYALFPHMTVAENIAYALKGAGKERIDSTVEECLRLVQLSGLGARYPHQLSGGQQQRTAVARALAKRPKLLLMDEPFSNIDNQVKQSLMTELRQLLKAHQITCIFVTHNKQEAFSFADKTAILNRGQLEQVGRTQSVFEQPSSRFVADFMEAGNLVPINALPPGLASLDQQENNSYVLLRENGFALDGSVNAKVSDSVYMGFRYRNRITVNDVTLFVESTHALSIGDSVNLRYLHAPICVRD